MTQVHGGGKFTNTLSWSATGYLGYWLVQLSRVTAASVAACWEGISLFWRVTPWQVQVVPLNRSDANFEFWFRLQWPLAFAADLLLLAAGYFLARRKPAGDCAPTDSARHALLLAGVWVAASRLWELARFQLGGTGRPLQQFLETFPADGQANSPLIVLILLALVAAIMGLGVLDGLFVLRPARSSSSLSRLALGALPLMAAIAVQTAVAAAAQIPQRFARANGPDWSWGGPLLIAGMLVLAKLWRCRGALAPGPRTTQAAITVSAALLLAAGLASAERVRLWRSEAALAYARTPHYEVLYHAQHWSQAQAEDFAAERESRFAGFEKRLPWRQESVPLRIVVYPDFRAMRRGGGGFPFSSQSFSSPSLLLDGTTARIAADGSSLSLADDARLYLAGVWGLPKSPVIGAWMARWLVAEWQEHALAAWAARLRSETEDLLLTDLLRESNEGALPPSYGEAIGGAWIEQLAARYPTAVLQRLYEASPTNASLADFATLLHSPPAELEKNWQEWVSSALPRGLSRLALSPLDGSFLRGMSLKPTELPVALVERELPRLDQLGTDAVALITHEHYRGGTGIQYHGNTTATDDRLIRAIRSAHRLGMRVLLKPQVYGGGEGFAGNICIEDVAARALWMESYRKLILHYARMAQDEGVVLFSVGNELGCLTKHESDWRKLITEVRRVYSGSLTYAANWGEEFETLGFWDALDFIGLNNYYPLTEFPGQGPEQMLTRARKVTEKIDRVHQRWRRPVLFTEAGFPSVKGGTFRPWDPPSRQPDVVEQAAGYEAVIKASGDRPWLRGVFWWAWHDGDLSPADKPAEQVLSEWYHRIGSKALSPK